MERAEFVTAVPLMPGGPSLAEGLAFFRERLGFEVAWEGPGIAGVRRGVVALNLVQSDDRHWAENASVSFGVTDLDALYAEYREIPPPARVGPLEVKVWGRREFHMILPSGVCFQFFQAP